MRAERDGARRRAAARATRAMAQLRSTTRSRRSSSSRARVNRYLDATRAVEAREGARRRAPLARRRSTHACERAARARAAALAVPARDGALDRASASACRSSRRRADWPAEAADSARSRPGARVERGAPLFPRLEPPRSRRLMWIDSHCHVSADEFAGGPRRGARARARGAASRRSSRSARATASTRTRARSRSPRPTRGSGRDRRRPPARREAPRRRRPRASCARWLADAARRRGRRVRPRLLVRALAARRAARGLRGAGGARARARRCPVTIHVRDRGADAYEELLEIWRAEARRRARGRAPLLHPRPARSRSARSTRGSSSPSRASSRSRPPTSCARSRRRCRSTGILVETDAPLLAPQGHRGERNEPARVALVGACLARVRQEPLERVAAATSANARRLFRLRAAGDARRERDSSALLALAVDLARARGRDPARALRDARSRSGRRARPSTS